MGYCYSQLQVYLLNHINPILALHLRRCDISRPTLPPRDNLEHVTCLNSSIIQFLNCTSVFMTVFIALPGLLLHTNGSKKSSRYVHVNTQMSTHPSWTRVFHLLSLGSILHQLARLRSRCCSGKFNTSLYYSGKSLSLSYLKGSWRESHTAILGQCSKRQKADLRSMSYTL